MTDRPRKTSRWRTSGTTRVARVGLALAACVAVAAVLDHWIQDKRLLLDYVRALAWPIVVGTALWWLRDPLRAKLADLLEVSAAVATARFAKQEAATRELEDDIAEASSVLVDIDGGHADSDHDPEPPAADGEVTTAVPPLATASAPGDAPAELAPGHAEMNGRIREGARRAAMERVIRESAAWGYDMAKIGFSSRPVPVIEWDDQGRPRILYARGQTPEELQAQAEKASASIRGLVTDMAVRRSRSQRMEDEIRKLERERDDPMKTSLHSVPARMVIDEQIKRLRRELKQIDPASPYAG